MPPIFLFQLLLPWGRALPAVIALCEVLCWFWPRRRQSRIFLVLANLENHIWWFNSFAAVYLFFTIRVDFIFNILVFLKCLVRNRHFQVYKGGHSLIGKTPASKAGIGGSTPPAPAIAIK